MAVRLGFMRQAGKIEFLVFTSVRLAIFLFNFWYFLGFRFLYRTPEDCQQFLSYDVTKVPPPHVGTALRKHSGHPKSAIFMED